MKVSTWSQTGAGLFDGQIPTDGRTNQAVYWAGYGAGDTNLEITVNENFRIWRKGVQNYCDYAGTLQILHLENGVFVDRTANYTRTDMVYGYACLNGYNSWDLTTNGSIPAGTYQFKAKSNQYRMDSEWFIEKEV
jgi:hypothetical protein